ncbi:MAG: hypothetical protein JXC85_04635 [Candidatus Aenigmarchaeota archaeon]|nr:hypothetical protein [Candidatus Aenigmarchaeota archaeon]
MAHDIMDTVRKRLKDGWLKAWIAVEVVAITPDAADSSLRKHMEKIGREEFCLMYKQEFKEPQKIPHPFERGKDAYSQVVEAEIVARRFEDLLFLVMNYAPSSIEILEPSEIRLKLGEAQGVLNSISELIHKFAMSHAGGVMIDAE